MLPSPPRKLRPTAYWQALRERPRTLFAGVLCVGIPLLQFAVFTFVFLPYFQNQDFEKILAAGKAEPGEVTRIEAVPHFSVNNVEPKRVFFRYKVNGVERNGSMETLSVGEVANWQKGRRIEIRDLDGRAVIVGLEPVTFFFPIRYMQLMWIVFILIGLPVLAYGLQGAVRKCRLLKVGVVRSAQVASFESEGFFGFFPRASINRFRAAYTYTDSTGRELSGSATSNDLMLLNQKKKGDEIEILVLPEDERRSTILDSATERALSHA